jgi:hypothetical protein
MKNTFRSIPIIILLTFCKTASATLTGGYLLTAAGTALGVAAGFFTGGLGWVVLGGAVGLGTGAVCTATDPPDLVNYATRSNPALIIPSVPSLPADWSPGLINLGDQVFQSTNLLIQSNTGFIESQDRLAGALLVGTASDVENQRTWLNEFATARQFLSSQVAYDVGKFVDLLEIEQPAIANFLLTTNQLKQIRDDVGSGNFMPYEQLLISAYQIQPQLIQSLQDRVGGHNRFGNRRHGSGINWCRVSL